MPNENSKGTNRIGRESQKEFQKMTGFGILIKAVQDILNCTESYVYKLIRSGDLAVVSNKPTRVSTKSIIKRLETKLPFLSSCRTAIDYHVKEMAHV